jgi:hypothetical protein
VVQKDLFTGVALATLVQVDKGDPAGQQRRVRAGRARVGRIVGLDRIRAGAERHRHAPLEGFRASEVQGCHDVVRGSRDPPVPDEVAHCRDRDGHQNACDGENHHELEQRETGRGSFHGLHYKERQTRRKWRSDGRGRRGDERPGSPSGGILMSARA